MTTKQKTILIAAGGTGGHILPAVSIAKSLKSLYTSLNPELTLKIEFVHTGSHLEKTIYRAEGFEGRVLSIGRLSGRTSWREKLTTAVCLPWALLKAGGMILKINPQLVLGVGGAVSGPVLLAAALLRRKTVLWEANMIPGLANRWLAGFTHTALVVFSQSSQHLKAKRIVQIGYPVRAGFKKISQKTKVHTPLRVLVVGGSQGSAAINKTAGQLAVQAQSHGLSFVHQTGEKQFASFKKLYEGLNDVQVFSFLHNIHSFYEWADVVVSRAGMGAIAELSAAGRAGVFIPLAGAANHHQLKNALWLKKQSAALVIEQKDLTAKTLLTALESLRENKQKILSLGQNIRGLKTADSSGRTARFLLSFMQPPGLKGVHKHAG